MKKIKPNERTLTNLLDLDRRVFLYFRNETVYGNFVEQAAKEGFVAPTGPHSFLAMNNDMTFNGIGGFAGHMKVHNDRKTIYVIDYAQYRNGAKDFIKPKGN